MKLILTHEVSGLGAAGDVVDVRDGYGRNYLLPRKLATPWTKGAEKDIASIRKAREVIQRSLATTQEIARLLGENAAASEITLNSIIESFTPAKPEEPRQEKDWRTLYKR